MESFLVAFETGVISVGERMFRKTPIQNFLGLLCVCMCVCVNTLIIIVFFSTQTRSKTFYNHGRVKIKHILDLT